MSSEVEEEIELTWNKIVRDTRKTGLRDGISDGHDSNFQKGFDDGFCEGFRNGFAIGRYKGALFAKSQQRKIVIEEDALLDKPRRGWCNMCLDENLLNQNIAQVAANQAETSNKNLQHLHSTYSEVVECKLPNELESSRSRDT